MIKTNRAGFTLVELLIVSVLGAVTLGAIYQTLMVQEESYRAGGAMIGSQDAMRTALGVLEGELREVAAIDGGVAGGSDIREAGPGTMTFRAQRKLAFICGISRSEKWVIAATLGNDFVSGDSVLIFVEGDPLKYSDDSWRKAAVTGSSSSDDTQCRATWPNPLNGPAQPLQKIQMLGADLTGVEIGSPIRAFQWITYGLYDFGHLGWGLGRHAPDQQPDYLVGNLASPADDGLRFRYFDANGVITADPAAMTRIEIKVKNRADPVNDIESDSMKTNLFLRNN